MFATGPDIILSFVIDAYKIMCKVECQTHLAISYHRVHTHGYDWFGVFVRQQPHLQQNPPFDLGYKEGKFICGRIIP